MGNLADIFEQTEQGQNILFSNKGSSFKKIRGLKNNIQINKAEYKKPSNQDRDKLLELFRLCFLNGFNDSRKVLEHVPNIYGQLFYKHHALKQRIRDSLEKRINSYGDFKAIKPNLEQILKNEFEQYFKKRRPTFPKDRSIDSAVKYNLAELDGTYIFSTYSIFLKSLLPNKISSSTDEEYLYNFRPEKPRFQREWLPRIKKAYFSGILISIIDEIEDAEKVYGHYQPYFVVDRPSDAVKDFFEKNRSISYSDHTASQIAHLIELRYRTTTKGKLKFDSLRKAVQRYR